MALARPSQYSTNHPFPSPIHQLGRAGRRVWSILYGVRPLCIGPPHLAASQPTEPPPIFSWGKKLKEKNKTQRVGGEGGREVARNGILEL